jgi:protein gp37
MSNSKIEWTEATWNPTTGCSKVSEGCKNCYAIRMAYRHIHNPKIAPKYAGTVGKNGNNINWTGKLNLQGDDVLHMPLRTKKPTTFFVNSMSDLFHPEVPFEFIDKVFAIMALTPQHTYQVLTKRPERMREYFNRHWKARVMTELDCMGEDDKMEDACIKAAVKLPFLDYLPNVWLGTSVENQKAANDRIPHLLQCPAAVRFLSCEPLLGPVGLMIPVQHDKWTYVNALTGYMWDKKQEYHGVIEYPKIHWVIAGGESGPGARPMHPDWVRSLRDQCEFEKVPFFFKQWGQHGYYGHGNFPTSPLDADPKSKDCILSVGKNLTGSLLDGIEHKAMPAHSQILTSSQSQI